MKISIDSYKGVIVPMITPLTKDGKIDKPSSVRLINYLMDNENIPFVLGTTGESASIPVPEKEELIQILTANKRPRIPAIAGVIGLTMAKTISQANKYIKYGVDAVVITLPYHYELTDFQIFNYYKVLAENIEGNIILYNIPKTVHQSIPIKAIEDLSQIENIIGIKDSEMNRERITESLRLWKNREDFSHFTGVNALMPLGIELGSKGLVPSTANIAPRLYVNLYKKCVEGNKEEAEKLYAKTLEWTSIYQEGKTLGDSLAALKYFMAEMNLCAPHVMLPLTEPNEEEKCRLSKKLKNYLAIEV